MINLSGVPWTLTFTTQKGIYGANTGIGSEQSAWDRYEHR